MFIFTDPDVVPSHTFFPRVPLDDYELRNYTNTRADMAARSPADNFGSPEAIIAVEPGSHGYFPRVIPYVSRKRLSTTPSRWTN